MRELEESDGFEAGEEPDIKTGREKKSGKRRKPSAKDEVSRNSSGKSHGEASSHGAVNVINRIKEKHAGGESVGLGIYRILPDGRYISVNPSYARILGCASPAEFLASFADLGSSWMDQTRFESMTNVINNEGACTIEVEVRTRDGGTKWLSNEVRAVRDEGGAVIYFEGFVQDVTARKRAMEKFHRTFLISPTMMCINSYKDARFIHANSSFMTGTGYGSEEIIGRTLSELSILTRDEIERFSGILREQGRLHNLEGRFTRKDGEVRDALFSAEIVTIDNEKCLLISAQDVTERKRAEAGLRRQSALLSGINDVLRKTFTSVRGAEIVEKCLAVARALTRSPYAFLCEKADDMLLEVMACSGFGDPASGSDKAQIMCNLNSDILRKGFQGNEEALVFNSPALCAARFLVPRGFPAVTSFLAVPVAADNQVIGLICLANKETGYTPEDTSDVKALSVSLVEGLHRIRMEESLRRSEIKYRTLLQSIRDGVMIIDREGRFVYVNDVITRRSGFPEDRFRGQYMFNIIKPEQRGAVRKQYEAAMEGVPPMPIECCYTTASGDEVWVEIHSSPIYDGDQISGAIATSRDITWRKAAEEQLKAHRDNLEKLVQERTKALEESERKYRHLVDNANAGVYQSTLAGERLYINENFIRMLGYESPEEISSVPPVSHYRNPAERDALLKLLLEKGHVDNYEVEFVGKRGRPVSALLSASLSNGIVSGIAFDITERKKAEEAVKTSEEKYRSLFDLESDAIFLVDIKTGLIADVNKAALAAFGYTREEMLGLTNVDLSAEPEKTRVSIRKKAVYIPLRYFRRKDGSTFPAEVVATHLTLLGRPAYLISARDITERRKTEEALLESEKKYRDLVENSLVGVGITTLSGEVVYVNEPLLRILGYDSLDDLGDGAPLANYRRPEDREKLVNILREKGKVDGYEVELLNKKGEAVNVLISATRHGDLLSGMMIDITPRKRAEDALKTSERNLRIILDSVHDAIFIHDVEGKILDVNAKMLEMYGVAREEALQLSITADYSQPANDMDGLAAEWQAVLDGGTRLFQWKARRPGDDSGFDAEVFLTRIKIDGEDRILAMVRDITERKIAEQLLLQSEEKYRSIVENALVAVFQAQWDDRGSGGITYVNSTFLRLLGYESLDEVRAAGTKKIFRDPDLHKALARTLLRGGSVEDQEVQLITRSGETVYWAIAVTLTGNTMSGMASDITPRKKVEALVKQQLVFIEQLLDCVPVPVYYKRTDGVFVGCNKAYADFLYLPKELIEKSTVWELFPPDIAERFAGADEELLRTRGIQTYEIRLPHPDGSPRDVIYTKTTYDDVDGNVAGIVGVIQDITERKQAEELIQASEARYRTLFDQSSDSILVLKDGVIVDCNRKSEVIFNAPKNEIMGMTPYQISLPSQPDGSDSRGRAVALMKETLAGNPQSFEWKCRRLTGEAFDAEVGLNRLDIGGEKLVQARVRDISYRKEAEHRVRRSEEKYRNLVENGLVAMCQTNLEGRIFYANDALLRMFQYDSPREIMKTNVQKMIARKHDWRAIQKKCVKDGHVKNIELEVFTKGGDKLTTMGSVTCDGSTMTWMLVDITERMRMEQELKIKSDGLYETNTALKVLLEQRDRDRQEIEEKMVANVKDLVIPYVESLTGTTLSTRQEVLLSTIKANLNEIVSPFLKNMRYRFSHFTPTEIKVAGFIKDGKTVKEIANILGVSESAINLHRQHIRNKLGLTNEKINLRTHLQAFGG